MRCLWPLPFLFVMPTTACSDDARQKDGVAAAWIDLAEQPDNPGYRKTLLRTGEPALEVLVDLLCGPKPGPAVERAKVEELVKRLGAGEFKVREKAQRELLALGAGAAVHLFAHRDDGDLEVRRRVRAALAILAPERLTSEIRDRLEVAATDLMEREWPLEEIRSVARRNISRLVQVDNVQYGWWGRPLGPLFASLRVSAKVEDRELLAKAVRDAREPAAVVCLGVMKNSISSPAGATPGQWRRVPPHDYSPVALDMMDPKRPQVFKQAMYLAEPSAERTRRLHAAMDMPIEFELLHSILFVLWCHQNDSKARDRLFSLLQSADDDLFADSLGTLTDHMCQHKGGEVIPKLRPILRGKDAKRRMLALERLDHYLGKEGVTLAADEAGRFLVSSDDKERELAKKVLINLHETKWIDVFDHLSRKGETEAIRAAARKLGDSWKEQKKK